MTAGERQGDKNGFSEHLSESPNSMSPVPADILSALLQRLYAGLMEADPWSAFLHHLAKVSESTFATLLLASGEHAAPPTMITPGADPEIAEHYVSQGYAEDPFVGLPEGQVVSFADFVPPEEMTESFRDYLSDAGSVQILGVDIHSPVRSHDKHALRPQARLRLTRDRAHGPYGETERQLMQAVVPHLRIALSLFSRIETSATVQGVYRTAIERMAVATFILGPDGRLLRSNEVGDQMLSTSTAVKLSNGRLILKPDAVQKKLHALLKKPPTDDTTQRLLVGGADFGQEMPALVRAIPQPTFGMEEGPVLALFISDPAHAGTIMPDTLRDLFQLTRQEAILAASLADGASLVDSARAMGIAHNTARAHLRMIFAKTGARRQSQLAHLIRSSVGMLGGDPSL